MAWREDAQYFSETASKVNRSLALGGVAVIWIFHQDNPQTGPALDPVFIWPLIILTSSLLFDLLHYVVGAEVWQSFVIHHEDTTSPDEHDKIDAPASKRRFVSFFFYIKITLMVIAYILLIRQVVIKLF